MSEQKWLYSRHFCSLGCGREDESFRRAGQAGDVDGGVPRLGQPHPVVGLGVGVPAARRAEHLDGKDRGPAVVAPQEGVDGERPPGGEGRRPVRLNSSRLRAPSMV